jgi:hypothetical protein
MRIRIAGTKVAPWRLSGWLTPALPASLICCYFFPRGPHLSVYSTWKHGVHRQWPWQEYFIAGHFNWIWVLYDFIFKISQNKRRTSKMTLHTPHNTDAVKFTLQFILKAETFKNNSNIRFLIISLKVLWKWIHSDHSCLKRGTENKLKLQISYFTK